MASTAQLTFIESLLGQHQALQPGVDVKTASKALVALDGRDASTLIDYLKALPAKVVELPAGAVAVRTSEPANRYGGQCVLCSAYVAAGEGTYRRGTGGAWETLHLAGSCTAKPVTITHTKPTGITEDGFYEKDGAVYKVQVAVHGSGRLYAKRLVPATVAGAKGSWNYEPGAVRQLTPENKLNMERAKELGRLYGCCMRCGAMLTDETSIAAGIGPICADRGF